MIEISTPIYIICVLLLTFWVFKFINFRIQRNKQKLKRIEESIVIAKDINDTLSMALKWSYLNHKKYEGLREELSGPFESIREYRQELVSIYPLVFDFFENKDFCKWLNDRYILVCKEKYAKYFADLDENGFWLTDRQLDAVFCNEDATLVNAGAWTGKTKTIESKVLHLVAHQGVSLDRILVMTFSKRSQMDMMNRIVSSLKKANIPHDEDYLRNTITTFHAFWKRILDQRVASESADETCDKLIGKGSEHLKVLEESQKMQILKKVFDTIRTNSVVQKFISEYILYYNTPQVAVSKFESLNDYYQYTKKTYRTLLRNGEYNLTVKSYWEVIIANYLWLHGIRTEYEPKGHFYTDEATKQKRSYKPDFYLPDYDIYIEYFWLDRNGKTAEYIATKDYQRRVDQKIRAHSVSENKFVDIRYADLQGGQEAFLKKLEGELRRHWVAFLPKNPEEVIEMRELSGPLVWITKTLNTFLSLFKESNATLSELKAKILGNFDVVNLVRNHVFLTIFEAFLEEYTKVLAEEWYMDFWDMIRSAIDIVKKGEFEGKYDYILIDEFQDISRARASLIQALVATTGDCRLFCVWDDWQSIYQFAGSDSSVFLHFSKYFGFTKEITLDRTFRFNQGISNLSSEFIMMNGVQKAKYLTSNDAEIREKVIMVQKEVGKYDYFFEILGDIVAGSPDKPVIKVLLLTRYGQSKYEDGFFGMLRGHCPKEGKSKSSGEDGSGDRYVFTYGEQVVEVTHLTSHKSKWLEADYVIVDYVNQGDRFDFPSNFEDDPILLIVTNEKNDGHPFAEERRLFYVSMTRGRNRAYIVYTRWKESLFLKDLLYVNRKYKNQIAKVISDSQDELSILWDETLPSCPNCSGKLQKRMSNGREFWGCSNYPQCDYTESSRESAILDCPTCDARMVFRRNGATWECFWGCTRYPACKGTRKFTG